MQTIRRRILPRNSESKASVNERRLGILGVNDTFYVDEIAYLKGRVVRLEKLLLLIADRFVKDSGKPKSHKDRIRVLSEQILKDHLSTKHNEVVVGKELP